MRNVIITCGAGGGYQNQYFTPQNNPDRSSDGGSGIILIRW